MMAIEQNPRPNGIVLTEAQLKARRQRNVAIGLVVTLLAALFYAVTIVKLGPGVIRPN